MNAWDLIFGRGLPAAPRKATAKQTLRAVMQRWPGVAELRQRGRGEGHQAAQRRHRRVMAIRWRDRRAGQRLMRRIAVHRLGV